MVVIPEKECTISYFRALWPSPVEITLQEALNRCLKFLPGTTDTKINLRDGLAEIRHRKITKRTLNLHIATWTDREEVSTVPHMEGRTEADLSSEPPGKDWDYLDGDGMILVSGNHYMIIQNKLHPNSLFQYIRPYYS